MGRSVGKVEVLEEGMSFVGWGLLHFCFALAFSNESKKLYFKEIILVLKKLHPILNKVILY